MWAVEQRVYDSGKVVAKVRKAKEGELNSCTENTTHDFYIDVFSTEKEAHDFAKSA